MAYLTVEEFAEAEGVSVRAVRKWIKDGMPTQRGPHDDLIIDIEEAEQWLDAEDSNGDEEEDEEADEAEEDYRSGFFGGVF